MSDITVIVGLGVTALSVARFLSERKIPFALIDSRPNPPHLKQFKELFPEVPVDLGTLDSPYLNQAVKLVVSPGVSVHEPAIVKQAARGVEIFGDIELFALTTKAPVIAITGTNAKSTVTTLVGMMAVAAGLRTAVGGNLGIPALDLLLEETPEVFVLELSSFQLETTFSLAPRVAAILNVTPDHMDRYETVQDYLLAKQRIYSHCRVAVCNLDDPATDPDKRYDEKKLQFTLQRPGPHDFGLLAKPDGNYLAFGDEALMPVRELPILGRHYQANALAALAIGYGFGLPFEPMLKTLREFKGLEHRCQLVRERHQVNWYNDSKGTNVGATLAAIEGLGTEISGRLILIAGGVGKNADFTPLIPAISRYVKTIILMGEAAPLFAELLNDSAVTIKFARTMQDAVSIADTIAEAGDCVLLSPACASFDMFNNFEHRGQVFTQAVEELA
jgi:UDP-N-acetylmuramoylalanine--D-glutamate ligase